MIAPVGTKKTAMVIVKRLKKTIYKPIGFIELMESTTAVALATHGIVEIIKNNDMVRIEIKKPINIDGKLRNAGDVIEVNYIKAERLNNNGDAVIIEFDSKPDPLIDNDEKIAEYEQPELQQQNDEQTTEQGVVEPTTAEAERKTTPKRAPRKTKTKK